MAYRARVGVNSVAGQCGKTFYSAAMEHWPKRGFREIDAVLLTHPHSVRRWGEKSLDGGADARSGAQDAFLGLDDLRGQ